MNYRISTNLDGYHRDYHLPDEAEELYEYLYEVDGEVCPHGPLDRVVSKRIDQGGTFNLCLPVGDDQDIDVSGVEE